MPYPVPHRAMILQFGDYPAALRAREEGLPENYRAQFYSLDAMDAFVGDGHSLTICLDLPAQEHQKGRRRIVGDRFMPQGSGLAYRLRALRSARRLITLAEAFAPTCMIVRTPGWALAALGGWALRRRVPVLPLLADYYPAGGLFTRLRRAGEIAVLRHPLTAVAANHNYPASRSLAAAGVPAAKIVPWDWPPVRHPSSFPQREGPAPDEPLRLLYAGLLLHSKGVGDLIRAAAMLGPKAVLDICGDGPDSESLHALIRDSGCAGTITTHGRLPNVRVVELMRAAHAVVVPSRPAYPEGMPNVVYEAWETRTPLICSDHPSFQGRLENGRGCLVFPAGDASALAERATRLRDENAYAALSRTTLAAWEAIQCPVTFGDLLTQWGQWLTDRAPLPCLAHSLKETRP